MNRAWWTIKFLFGSSDFNLSWSKSINPLNSIFQNSITICIIKNRVANTRVSTTSAESYIRDLCLHSSLHLFHTNNSWNKNWFKLEINFCSFSFSEVISSLIIYFFIYNTCEIWSLFGRLLSYSVWFVFGCK